MRLQSLILSESEQEYLTHLIRRSRTPQNLALRARIVLACSRMETNHEVASALGVSLHTVGKWRRRYMEDGVAGLSDHPRSGKPRRFPRDQVEALITQTLATLPPEGGHWSVRSVASVVGLSPATIGRTWRDLRLRQVASTPREVSGRRYGNGNDLSQGGLA